MPRSELPGVRQPSGGRPGVSCLWIGRRVSILVHGRSGGGHGNATPSKNVSPFEEKLEAALRSVSRRRRCHLSCSGLSSKGSLGWRFQLMDVHHRRGRLTQPKSDAHPSTGWASNAWLTSSAITTHTRTQTSWVGSWSRTSFIRSTMVRKRPPLSPWPSRTWRSSGTVAPRPWRPGWPRSQGRRHVGRPVNLPRQREEWRPKPLLDEVVSGAHPLKAREDDEVVATWRPGREA